MVVRAAKNIRHKEWRLELGNSANEMGKTVHHWGFPSMGDPLYRWMIAFMENPIKMDDLGVPLFQEITILPRNHRLVD